jgi:glycine cleavage system regulatory protein
LDILEAIGKVQLIKISGIGRDRLGIVNKVAALLESNGGNIFLERSMRAAEDFATIVIAEFKDDNQSGIESSLRAFQEGVLGSDFFVTAEKYSLLSGRKLNPDGRRYTVVIEGLDQAGIVASITLTLLKFGLNLDGTDSEVTYEPFSGTKKFSGSFDITIPEGFDLDGFEGEVRQVAQNHGLDVVYIKELPPRRLTN